MGISEGLKRGTIEIMLLTLLKKEDMYGYQLCQELERQSHGLYVLQEGSLYPPLYRMLENGYITDRKELVGRRRTRVYYHLEKKGERYLQEITDEYVQLNRGILFALGFGDLEGFLHHEEKSNFEGQLADYISEIKKQLCCDRKAKKQFISDLQNTILEYREANPNATFDELIAHFGTPETIARDFLENAEEYRSRESKNKKALRITLIALLTALLIFVGIIAIVIVTNNRRTAGYYYTEEVKKIGVVSE